MSSGLVALLDDVATIADDVATMTIGASKKAVGIVTDDMAVTAENMQGIRRDRELRVIWEVAKGSLKNKMFYLVPGALALSAFAPAAIPALLIGGGGYLCYEGAEKVLEKFHKHEERPESAPVPVDAATYEKQRIDGAIRTDMILSGEIMVMGLNSMSGFGMAMKAAALPAFGLVMTAGVYGTVAGLVKLDDLGEWMTKRDGSLTRKLGEQIVRHTPKLLHGIAAVGTLAMLAVGGNLVAHNIPMIGHALEAVTHALPLGGVGQALAGYAVEAGFGLMAGLGTVGAVMTGIPGRAAAWVREGADSLRQRFSPVRSAEGTCKPSPAPKAPEPVAGPVADVSVSPSRRMKALSPALPTLEAANGNPLPAARPKAGGEGPGV